MSLPIKVTQSAAGRTAWIPLDTLKDHFVCTVACVCSSNISATYSVEYSMDQPNYAVPCSISRSTTTATLALPNHGLTTSDSIIVSGSGDSNLDGTYQVASVPDQNSVTYTVADTGATTSITAKVAVMRVFTSTGIAGSTANDIEDLQNPRTAVRLNITAYTAGYVTMIVVQSGV